MVDTWLHLMLDTARLGMPAVRSFAAGVGQAMLVELSVMEQRYHAVTMALNEAAMISQEPGIPRRAGGGDE